MPQTSPRRIHQIMWGYPGDVATGDQRPWFLNNTGVTLIVEHVRAVIKAGASAEMDIDVEKCAAADLLGAPSWASIFDTTVTIDAGELDSLEAATPAALDAAGKVLAPGDALRLNIVDIGTDGADLTVACRAVEA